MTSTVASGRELLEFIKKSPSFKVMEDFAETLEKCRGIEVTHRDFIELRSSFFLTATRYGGKIFPKIVHYVDDVSGVIKFLASLEDEQSMIRHAPDQIGKCKKYKRKGEELEDMHNYVGGNLMNLQTECLRMGRNLDDEREELIVEATKLNHSKLWFGTRNKEKATKRREEADALEIALELIVKLEVCCTSALAVVQFVNKVLGKIITEVGATANQLRNLNEYDDDGDGPRNRTDYFKYIINALRKFADGLAEFQESRVTWRTTLSAIEQAEKFPDAKVVEWDLQLKTYVNKVKAERDEAEAEVA